jgi:hypothetical protein
MVDHVAKTARLQRLLFGAEQAEAAGEFSHAQVIWMADKQNNSIQACSCIRSHHACMPTHARCSTRHISAELGTLPHARFDILMDVTQELWLELRCFLAAEAADNAVTAAHAALLLDTCGHHLAGLLSRLQPSQ